MSSLTNPCRSVSWLGALVACLAAIAQPAFAAPVEPTMTEIMAEADDASRSFDTAQFRKDTLALDRMLSANMVYIRGSGEVSDRSGFIAAFASPDVAFEPFVLEDRRVISLGPTVVAVTADGTIRGTDNYVAFEDRFRFTDIFRKERGGWKVIFVQVTRKAKP